MQAFLERSLQCLEHCEYRRNSLDVEWSCANLSQPYAWKFEIVL